MQHFTTTFKETAPFSLLPLYLVRCHLSGVWVGFGHMKRHNITSHATFCHCIYAKCSPYLDKSLSIKLSPFLEQQLVGFGHTKRQKNYFPSQLLLLFLHYLLPSVWLICLVSCDTFWTSNKWNIFFAFPAASYAVHGNKDASAPSVTMFYHYFHANCFLSSLCYLFI